MDLNTYISSENNPYSGSEDVINPFDYQDSVISDSGADLDGSSQEFIDIPQQFITSDSEYIYDADGNEIPLGGSGTVVVGLDGVSALSDDIMELASSINSTQGYFNTSVLDVLDRVVEGSSKDYYIAYRYDADTYNAYMYLADKFDISGSRYTLYDAVFVDVYRYRYNNTSTYNYYYQAVSAGTVELDIGANALFYTNMVSDYPTLGGKAEHGVFTAFQYLEVALFIVVIFMLYRVFRRG